MTPTYPTARASFAAQQRGTGITCHFVAEQRVRRRVVVSGSVQGVFFRDTCQRLAARHRVSGWVRNLADGSVEAAFEGEPGDVGVLIEWCRRGPADARVAAIEIHDEAPRGEVRFDVRPTPP